jgi:hypothetical protein
MSGLSENVNIQLNDLGFFLLKICILVNFEEIY